VTGVGLCVPQLGFHVTAEVIRTFAQRAESLGFSSLWVQDHFMYVAQPENGYGNFPGAVPPPEYASVWQPLELLAALSAWTTTVTLGASVLVTGNHWPVQLAARLATIDQLTAGRLVVGLGAGWSKEEHTAAGTDFHRRGSRMEEFISVLESCWGADPVRHRGSFFEIPECSVNPKPVQRADGSARPPLISGLWSTAGLERTVRRFDGWNPAGLPAAAVADTVAAMDLRRQDLGLPPLSVWHRAFVSFPARPGRAQPGIDGLRADLEVARAKGFREVIVECNFWEEIDSPAAWLAVPDRLAPLLG